MERRLLMRIEWYERGSGKLIGGFVRFGSEFAVDRGWGSGKKGMNNCPRKRMVKKYLGA